MKSRHLALTFVALLSAAACSGDPATDSDESFVSAKEGGQVELFRSAKDKQFYFRVKAKNGENILASEGYRARAGAERGIYSVLHNGLQVGAFKLHPASSNPEGTAGGEWYFNLHAPNGGIVGTSEVYSSKQAAKQGRSTVMGYIAGKPRIDDWANQCGANLFVGADDQLYFHLKGINGRVVLASEGYPDEATAKKGMRSALSNGALVERFKLLPASSNPQAAASGDWYFNLRAGNNEVVGTSEVYSSKQAAETGMRVVMNAANAQQKCVADWVDDGDALTPLVCSGDWGHPLLGDVTYELDNFVTKTTEVTLYDFEQVLEPNSLQERQIRYAASHNGGVDMAGDFETVMEFPDEETLWIKELEVGQARYTWVKFYAGENESGMLFAEGTDRAVVRVSDGDLQNCDVAPEDVLQHGDECAAADQCGDGLLCSGLTVGYAECRPTPMAGTFTSDARVDILEGGETTSSIEVDGLATVPEDVIVTLDIDHPRPADLIVALHQPGGGYEVLWDSEADPKTKISAGWGIERDNEVNGSWTLEIVDSVTGETGELNGWSMFITSRWD